MMQLFGIRHHGPGCAASLRASLAAMQPDIVLIEGPTDANGVLHFVTHAQMEPPVALLVYAPDRLHQVAYYPFAVFSPEWQGIQYALHHDIPVRFIDLPQKHQLVAEEKPDLKSPAHPTLAAAKTPSDPLLWLAAAAGFDDSERWWNHLIEQRQNHTDLFAGILAAMVTLRQEWEQTYPPNLEQQRDRHQAIREAHMRKMIRQAQKEGFEAIAIICGAWHTPALMEPFPKVKDDNALLKGLPNVKVNATWIPWTYGRLTLDSGYGAGIDSPGWYHHLWQSGQTSNHPQPLDPSEPRSCPPAPASIAIGWLTQVAYLLRHEGFDVSSAHVIEAVRLAETLAALRDRPLPGLAELDEAAQTVLCQGEATPMSLIRDKLTVSDRLGTVPDDIPIIPLQQDLQQCQKRLRLKPVAEKKTLTLDLRNPTDLARSQLLHQLSILGIDWGTPLATSGKGTFKEGWVLQWQPDLAIALIEAGRWGNTVAMAATAYLLDQVAQSPLPLATLTRHLDRALVANLAAAIAPLLQQIQTTAALSKDLLSLMMALPALAQVVRYRNVRQTDTQTVIQVVDGLVTRICLGLGQTCRTLDDEAAQQMAIALQRTHQAIQLLRISQHQTAWFRALSQLLDHNGLNSHLLGRCCRILLDAGEVSPPEAARRLHLALSVGNDPAAAAQWLAGFLEGSGLLLIHDDQLWAILDQWVTSLTEDAFIAVLPLLRRTFSSFTGPELRQMGDRVRQESSPSPSPEQTNISEFPPTPSPAPHRQKALETLSYLLHLTPPPSVRG
ncbi:MAG: DUF5682 family protein [Leptolyngbyaceae bacterium]|nr:DUF5682 family protein [Leptolyngbyaceae bacterium]